MNLFERGKCPILMSKARYLKHHSKIQIIVSATDVYILNYIYIKSLLSNISYALFKNNKWMHHNTFTCKITCRVTCRIRSIIVALCWVLLMKNKKHISAQFQGQGTAVKVKVQQYSVWTHLNKTQTSSTQVLYKWLFLEFIKCSKHFLYYIMYLNARVEKRKIMVWFWLKVV